MSDNFRTIPAPTNRPGGIARRTLGDVKARDASTGSPIDPDVERDELRNLIRQNTELNNASAGLPPPTNAPNVRERTVQLAADSVSDDLEYEEDKPVRRARDYKPTPPAEISNKAAASGPSNPPPIQPAQYEARRKRAKDEDKEEQEGPVYTGRPAFVQRQISRNAKYERVPLLSGFVFYPWKDLQARKINVPDQIKISKAQKTQNITAFIDAMGATIDPEIDIRDFSVPDFYYFLYWHRFNSYTSTPFLVSWTSKYGNRNDYRITDTSLKYDPPKITGEEYREWQAKGFCIPTVRDMEVFMAENLNEDELDLFLRAQFFSGLPKQDGEPVSIQDKIDYMISLGEEDVNVLEQLSAFREAINFGVSERTDVTDAKFDPAVWAESLEKQAAYLRLEAESLRELNFGVYIAKMAEADEANREAVEIRSSLEAGGEVLPDIETITLNVGILDFFPNL